MIDVQRTDFVAVPTRDRERAAAFYGETLGLRKNQTSDTWIEFQWWLKNDRLPRPPGFVRPGTSMSGANLPGIADSERSAARGFVALTGSFTIPMTRL